ncbi:YetF domain-containing protein [Enterococcus sp. ZJ1668]|uniref:DUF421 domain-containing protein n=1 Tax=Enterococcus sp. ZJ1668 TaxID=2709402 RepID=UPI0013EADE1B|nr:YetF domain-containing protein [Enterococcus sp. ZJ1668]
MFFTIALKLVFGLMGLLLVVRLLGKKSMSEITPFDLVYTLVLGGILEESTYDDNVHVGHVLFAIALWALMIFGIERIVQKNEKVNRWVKGEPSVLIKDGVLNMAELSKNHIEMEQLRAILRQQGCFSLENAKHVVLENAGQMSVLKKSEDDKALSILLIDEGQIQYSVLRSNRLDEAWLREHLKQEGHETIEDLLYVEWSEEKGFYTVTKEEILNTSYRIDG